MQQEIKSIVLITPDDWHLHLRESPIIDKVFPYSFTNYGRAIIMPNLEIPIIKFSQAKDCLLYTSPSPRDGLLSRMPSSA